MNKKTQIVMLPAECLEHHPENPRKKIGDIAELTDSIKANGILQNLTVVPKPDDEGKYLVVIGNRRYEAGTAAGLKEFPCVISDMNHTKQLETMLIENMNRSDLTVYEQATTALLNVKNIYSDLWYIEVNQSIGYSGNGNYTTYSYNCTQKIKIFADFIEHLGYVMSDEEKQLIDGTHRLYHLEDNEEAE